MKKTLLICIMCLVAALCLCLSACNPEEHTHSFTSGDYKSTASGHSQKCTGCDEYGEEEAHDFGPDGKCTVCGYEHIHNFAADDFQTSENGHKQKCTDCNQYGPEQDHVFGTDGKKCTVCGYKQHTHDFTSGKFQTSENGHKQKCKDCDEYEETEHPHEFDADGKTCKVCGYEKKDSEPTEPTHHLTEVEAKQPSCTEEGNIEYYTCSDSACKGKFFDEKGNELDEEKVFLEKVDHVYVEHDEKAATCTEKGMKKYYTCENCDTLFDSDKKETTEAQLEIETTEHSYTFKSNGVNDHAQICSNCGSAQDNEAHELNDKGECKCGFKASNDLLTFEYNDDKTAKVTAVTPPATGDFEVVVPRTVINEGETYTVTTIGNLGYNDLYVSFIMPDTITTIDGSAFYYQSKLASFVVSKNIESAGNYSFSYLTTKILNVFYSGTKDEWATTKPLLTKAGLAEDAKVFFYSATDLGEDSVDTWHYVNDRPVIWHQDEFTYSNEEFDFIYWVSKGTATVISYKGEGGLVAIPETITVNENEYTVTAIDSDIFNSSDIAYNDVTGLSLPDSIESIAKQAFYNNSIETIVIGPNITKHIDQIDPMAFYYLPYGVTLKLFFKGDEDEYTEFYKAISDRGVSDLLNAIKDKYVYLQVDKDTYDGYYGTWEFDTDGKTPKILSEHLVEPLVLPEKIYGKYECSFWGSTYTLVVTEENKIIVTDSYGDTTYTIISYSNGTLEVEQDDNGRTEEWTYDEATETISYGYYYNYTKVEEEEGINLPEGIEGEYKGTTGTVTIDRENLTVTLTVGGFDMICTITSYSSGEATITWSTLDGKMTYDEVKKTVHIELGSSDYGTFNKVEESGGDEIDEAAFKKIVNGKYTSTRGYEMTVDYPNISIHSEMIGDETHTITEFKNDGTFKGKQSSGKEWDGLWSEELGVTKYRGIDFTKQQSAESEEGSIPTSLNGKYSDSAKWDFITITDNEVVIVNDDYEYGHTFTITSYEYGTCTFSDENGIGGSFTYDKDTDTITYNNKQFKKSW